MRLFFFIFIASFRFLLSLCWCGVRRRAVVSCRPIIFPNLEVGPRGERFGETVQAAATIAAAAAAAARASDFFFCGGGGGDTRSLDLECGLLVQ